MIEIQTHGMSIVQSGEKKEIPLVWGGGLEESLQKINEKGEEVLSSIPDDYMQLNNKVANIVTPQMFGAKGDGVTDDTEAIVSALETCDDLYLPVGNYIVDYKTCKSKSIHEHCYGEGVLHYTNYDWGGTGTTYGGGYHGRECRFGGIFDTEIYKSMHRLAEAVSAYAVSSDSKDFRQPYVSTKYSFTGDRVSINSMGAIRLRYGYECPDNFTLCLGKGRVWGLKNNKWYLLVDEFLNGALYKESWADDTSVSVTLTQCTDHVEVALTKELWYSGDVPRLLHTYTDSYTLKDGEVNTEYSYFICSQEVWVKEKEYEDYFLINGGSDLRCADSTLPKAQYINEFGQGRALIVKSYPRICYFHNIPNDAYGNIPLPISSEEYINVANNKEDDPVAWTYRDKAEVKAYQICFPPVRETLTDSKMKYVKLIEFSHFSTIQCKVSLYVEGFTEPIDYNLYLSMNKKTFEVKCSDSSKTEKYITCVYDSEANTLAVYLRNHSDLSWKMGTVTITPNVLYASVGHVLVDYESELTITNPQWLYTTTAYNKYCATLELSDSQVMCNNGEKVTLTSSTE